jgi:hypothetical protein
MTAERIRLEEDRKQKICWKKWGPYLSERQWGTEKFQSDPHWRDHILFYEYFHGDNGAGLGASHQTGWTGLVARMIVLFGRLDPEKILEAGRVSVFASAQQTR